MYRRFESYRPSHIRNFQPFIFDVVLLLWLVDIVIDGTSSLIGLNKTKKLNMLGLCAGNSTCSLITEGLLNHLGANFLNAYLAVSDPTGMPKPIA